MEQQIETQDALESIVSTALAKVRLEVGNKASEVEQSLLESVKELRDKLQDRISVLESYTTQAPLVVNVGSIEKPKSKIVHNKFDTVTRILQSTKRKEKNIMLVGGAGSGKTHLVSSVADALGRSFYPMSVGLQTTKSDLLGFVNATGGYMPTILRQAYEFGGVLLLDEFDSAHAGVVTILNSMLANGHCSFPDKVVEKHPDFICICACNTYGRGGSVEYVGRNRLDSATLDRFIVVDVEYDKYLERALTNHSVWEYVVYSIRSNVEKNGIKMIVSPRALMDGADLLDQGFKIDEVLDMVVFKGCTNDVKTKLLDGIDFSRFKSIPEKLLSKLSIGKDKKESEVSAGTSSHTPSRIFAQEIEMRHRGLSHF